MLDNAKNFDYAKIMPENFLKKLHQKVINLYLTQKGSNYARIMLKLC